MSEETLVDPEFTYDTVEMTQEEYARLKVPPVKSPVTPHFNVNRMLDEIEHETPNTSDNERREELQKRLRTIDHETLRALMYRWTFWARDNQLAPPGFWTFWLLLAGRGFGKTRTGAEWVNDRVERGLTKRINLIAPTAADVRKVMVEGESGILATAPPWNRPIFEPSKLQLTWPNGAIAQMFSAEEPERLRGPQCDTIWADELCAWQKMQATWDMAMFGFRLGKNPQACITTTPKPVALLKDIMKGELDGSAVVTRGSTYDNKGNLAAPFFKKVVSKYEGTRLGRQELEAAILEDMPGALWNRADIDRTRIPCNVPPSTALVATDPDTGLVKLLEDRSVLSARARDIVAAVGEDLARIVVAVDPNASNDEGSDEIGVVVCGKGVSGRGYLLADLSLRGSPNEWASAAVLAYDLFKADRIIGEANQGGNMVEHTITSSAKFLKMQGLRQSDYVSITLVHATRGKVTRAEPVSALYEQKKVSHIGTHRLLEDQMCLFTSDFDRKSMGFSPDRVDALVWGFTHLFLEASDTGILEFYQLASMKQSAAKESKADPMLTKMKAPDGVSTAYGRTGDRYDVDPEGFIFVKKEDSRALRGAGFQEVTA